MKKEQYLLLLFTKQKWKKSSFVFFKELNITRTSQLLQHFRGLCGRDRMVVGLITYVIGIYHYWICEFEYCSGEVCLIQHYVIKFVSDLRQFGGFLQVLRFPTVESDIKP
jgi:hypothetical protein